MAKETEDK